MPRMITYPENEVEEMIESLETIDADLGSLCNNIDNREKALEFIRSMSQRIRKVHRILEGE